MCPANPCPGSSRGTAAGIRLWPDKQPLSRQISINNPLSYTKPAVRCHAQSQNKSSQPNICMSVCTHRVPSLHVCTLTDSCRLTQTQIHPSVHGYIDIGVRTDLVRSLCQPVCAVQAVRQGNSDMQWPCSAIPTAQSLVPKGCSACLSPPALFPDSVVDHTEPSALTLRLVKVV